MKFHVVCIWEDEFQKYVADVPELPGGMSQGKTIEEVVDNIKNAIKGYHDVQAGHGRP